MDLIHDSRSSFVKITIDSPNNISIAETTRIAKRVKNDDNIISMFPNGCHLEVGTPGVGADLVERFQYEKNIGRKIKVEYKTDDFKIVSDIFRLVNVENEGVWVTKNKYESLIMFENIVSAQIKVSFE